MLAAVPGSSLAHRLDPRSKLGFQLAFAAVAFAYTTPRGLLALAVLALAALAAAETSPLSALWAVRFVLPFLLAAPAVSTLTLGSPWVDPAAAVDPALASGRNLLVVAVSVGYVRTTTVRESRAAIQWLVPGRVGGFLGLGVALVARFLPVLRRDLLAIRAAEAARLGTERPLRVRMATLVTTGLARAFSRADRLALAMQARCLSWNPTLPALRFGRADAAVLVGSVGLLGLAVASLFGVDVGALRGVDAGALVRVAVGALLG